MTLIKSNLQTLRMDWLNENKEWFLSGLGVFILGLFVTWWQSRKKNKKMKSSKKMSQKSGKNSRNIQIGGDFNG